MQMLSCRACLRHCLRAVTHRAPLTPLVRRVNPQRSPSRALALALQRRRDYATVAKRQSDAFDAHFQEEEAVGASRGKNSVGKPFRQPQKGPYHGSSFRQELRESRRKSLVDLGHGELSPTKRRRLKTELEWTGGDPLKLAETVQKRLAKGDLQATLDLVRFASSLQDCVVSWNHIIDHAMTEGRPSQALKIYNEMKKRGQKPDAYTYMIVLRGLGNHAHNPSSVGSALAVYHSMSAPNARVPPSVMHSNAILRVCSRANDMDALWGVAADLPEKGPGAADAFTYTTILQAMRQHALMTPPGMSVDEVAHKREETIVDGRRMWADIVAKWRSGDIIIDENLVCAMGQLLLIGQRPRDWDDVLSLFQQTMGIPRLLRHLGDDRKVKMPLFNTPPDMRIEDSARIDPTDKMRRGGEFDPVELGKTVGRGRRSMAFAKPGNPSLSLILDSCLKMAARKAAEDYFHLLTDSDSWGIAPDEANLHAFLRILRKARASAAAVDFLKDEFDGPRFRVGTRPQAKTFRMAMSTCVRDKNNPHVLDHANSILDMMGTFLADRDPRTLAMYTRLLMSISRPDQILKGLARLGPHFVNVKNMVKNDGRKPLAQGDWDGALEFLYGMMSCYDRLKNKSEVPREHYAVLTERKAKIQAFYTREMLKREKRQGKDVRNPELNPSRRAELKTQQRRQEESMGRANEDDGDAAHEEKERWAFEGR